MSSRIERRSRTGFTGATAAVGLAFLLTGAAMASWFARVPTVKAGFGLGDGAMGALLACVAVGSLIAMPLAGTMMARLGGRPVLAIAEALLCAALVLPALAPNPAALGIALTLLGAGHGLLDVTMNAQASALEQAAERALMPMLHALFSIGGFAGAMLGALFAHVGVSVAVHLGLVALLFAVLAVPAYRFVPHIHAPGGLAPSETAAPVLAWPGRGLAALAVISFCALMAEGVINDWSAIFLAQTLNAGPGFAPLGYAVFSVTMIIGRLAGGPLTHHIR
ncbi:MFS transporter, partial [Salinisphaera sp.]|uniref:MFS transporter n=1 Tax=Salinisphaera sp. TaxID=1914330 RepID=UPI002D785260